MDVQLLYEAQGSPWGGVNSFFRNLKKYAKDDNRIDLVNSPQEADIILTAGNYIGPGKRLSLTHLWWLSKRRNLSWPFPFPYLKTRERGKLVFRLDGLREIYTGLRHPSDSQLIRNLRFADGVVFQSNFSREIFEKRGVVTPHQQSIITNGADENIFFPKNLCKPPIDRELILISSSWSTNSFKGFKEIARISEEQDVRVKHIGRWPDGISSSNVARLGVMRPHEMATTLQEGNFFFFPSRKEACSNVLYEALACALPPIYLESGGNSQICQDGRFGIPFREADFEKGRLKQLLSKAREQHDYIRSNIVEDLERFTFKRCYEEYLKFFESMLV